MRKDSGHIDGPPPLVPGAPGTPAPVLASSAAGTGQAEATVALPGWRPLRERVTLSRPRALSGPMAGRLALATLILCALAVVLFDTAGPSLLVPRSNQVFPGWEAGPLHGLIPAIPARTLAVTYGLSAVIVAMALAYGVVMAAVRSLSMRLIVVCIVALHVILLLGPPFQLTDVFNYLGYARLGGLHGMNPYTHVIGQEMHDPVYHFATWDNLHSPYGELFTALSYPLAFLPLSVAYWVVKAAAVGLSLAFIAIVCYCARRLGRDPRYAAALVAFNPVYLIYAIGGFHNDFYMLVPSTAAIAFLLARRDRSAGAALMLAVAVKFTAVLLLPFLLVGARPARRRREVVIGAVLAAVPLAIMSLALFGLSLPNLSQQSSLLTPFSFPNLFGEIIGVGGGTPGVLRLATVALVVVVALLVRRRGDWLSHAGWATVALIASLAWLMPWYVIWLLPLAALGSSVRLRRAAAGLTVFVLLTFLPASGVLLGKIHFNPLSGSAGQASSALQSKLSWYH
jgi:hypothetical protein